MQFTQVLKSDKSGLKTRGRIFHKNLRMLAAPHTCLFWTWKLDGPWHFRCLVRGFKFTCFYLMNFYRSRPSADALRSYEDICLQTWRSNPIPPDRWWLEINWDGNRVAKTIPNGNNTNVGDKVTDVVVHARNIPWSPRWTEGHTSHTKRSFPPTCLGTLWRASKAQRILL